MVAARKIYMDGMTSLLSHMESPAEGGVSSSIRDIDPDTAEALLVNDSARGGNIRDAVVSDYARQMQGGEWRLNGEPIVVSERGRLMNGRKRLRACVRANTAFRCLLVVGVPDDVGSTVDARRPRNLPDMLSIGGTASVRTVAGALRTLYRLRDGTWNKGGVTVGKLLGIHEANPGLAQGVTMLQELGVTRANSTIVAMHHLFSQVDARAADMFVRNYANAENQPRMAPERLLYSRMQMARGGGTRMGDREVAILFIKAWNAVRMASPIKMLKCLEGEAFPAIVGLPERWSLLLGTEAGLSPQGEGIQPHAEVAYVTPELASEYLEANTRNRSTAIETIAKYARDLSAGKWKLNGDTIKIGRSGTLLDGQHRLLACVKSGQGFWTLVVHDVDDATFDTLDVGVTNSFQSVLSNRGIKHAGRVASAARLLWQYKHGSVQGSSSPSNIELEELLAANEGLVDSAAQTLGTDKIVAANIATMCHYLFNAKDCELARQFFEKLESGMNVVSKGDPVYKLRQRMLGIDRVRNSTRTARADPAANLAVTIKAWNALRAGRELNTLKWLGVDEGMPAIV